jgi:Ni,Fe-hydrogenase III component G
MEAEEIKGQLVEKFPVLMETARIQRASRMWVEAPYDLFSEIFGFLHKIGFTELSAITGLDEGDNLGVIYHLNKHGRLILNLHIRVPKTNSVIKTITDTFPSAEAYEKELEDLLGMTVEGLTPGYHYPLPDSWPKNDHPLLKTWKPAEQGVK